MNNKCNGRKTEYVAQQMKADILKQKYGRNERLPSSVDFAKKYSVTKETVNMALNRLVSEGLVYRKKGSGTYLSEIVVKNKSIGVCLTLKQEISSAATPTSFAIFEGVLEAAEARGYHPVILSENRLNLKDINALNISGLLLSAVHTSLFMDQLLPLTRKKLPYIFLDRAYWDDDINYVEEYSPGEIYKAVNYLFSLHHKRIACIGFNSEKLIFRNFFIGYEQAMREKGLFDPALTKCVSKNTEDEVKSILGELLALPQRPSVVFLFYWNAFDNLYKALEDFNLNVPDDISLLVISLGALRRNNLEIATLGVTKNYFGKIACNLLLDLIENKISVPVNRKLKLELYRGNSLKDNSCGKRKEQTVSPGREPVFIPG
ncbi:MAG: GntR family transcriptional regulator [Victivallaceae bacterium]|nr:GntR family transcriptional regulator [Victivallaceae bacterium]